MENNKKGVQEYICEVLGITMEDLMNDRYVDCITPAEAVQIAEAYASQPHKCCHDGGN